MSIKRKKNNDESEVVTPLRQQLKQIIGIDIIDGTDEQDYIDNCLDDICKVLERYLDIQIQNWVKSFEHHQRKELEWKYKVNFDLSDIHHSMKIYSNGAIHSLQFFKEDLK